MEYQYSKKNLRLIRIGLIWNGLAVLLTAGLNGLDALASGGSTSDALSSVLFVLIVAGLVLGLNVYAFNFMLNQKTKRAVSLALLMAIAGILSLNLFGTLIIIYGYLRIRKYDLIEAEEAKAN